MAYNTADEGGLCSLPEGQVFYNTAIKTVSMCFILYLDEERQPFLKPKPFFNAKLLHAFILVLVFIVLMRLLTYVYI